MHARISASTCVAAFLFTFLPAANADDVQTPDVVVASSFGFNEEDATEALQKAINSGAKKVVVDRQKTPWNIRPVRLRSNLELVLEEGTEIVAKKGEFRKLGDCLLTARDVSGLTIRGEGKGAVLRMRKRDYWNEPYEKSEWRHGVSLLSARDVLIENIQIAETGGDGIYVGVASSSLGPCRNVTIRKTDCVENNRQGISVISVDGLLIEDSVLRETNGTAPEAGIDFEPNHADEQITNVVMRRVAALNNAGDGIAFYLPNMRSRGHDLSFLIEDCEIAGNSLAGLALTVANGEDRRQDGAMTVRRCNFYSNRLGIAVRSKWAASAPMLFEKVRIVTPSAAKIISFRAPDWLTVNADAPRRLDDWTKTTTDSGVSLIAVGTDQEANGGVEFRNVEIFDADPNAERELLLALRDASNEGVGFEKIAGAIAGTKIKTDGTAESKTFQLDDDSLKVLFPELSARRVSAWKLANLSSDDPASSEVAKELAQAWKKRASEDKTAPKSFRARGDVAYYFYAEAGEDVSWKFIHRQIGKYPVDKVEIKISEPDGTKRELESMPGNETQKEYRYRAETSGWRRMYASFGASTLELTDASTPVLTAASPALDVFATTGRFEFYVPQGTTDLGLRVVGSAAERVTARVFDPEGREVGMLKDVSALGTWSVAEENGQPIAPASGFWSVEFSRPSVAILEDYVVTLLGVPALLR